MSSFNLSDKTEIKQRQLAWWGERVRKTLDKEVDQAEIDSQIQSTLSYYSQRIGEPLLVPRVAERYQLPFREDILENMGAIQADMEIISREHNLASLFLVDSFNTVHSEKKRLTNRIQNLNNLIGDVLLLSGEQNQGVVYFKESFQSTDALDTDYALDSVVKATISVSEGILTLGRKDTKDLSLEATVAQVTGNGIPGSGHLAKKITLKNNQGVEEEVFRFTNELNPNRSSEPKTLLDNRPDTVFEYQMVNVPNSFKKEYKHYNFDWTSGQEEGETLRMKLVVELNDIERVNWINLHPYYPTDTSGKIIVYSIRTSLDGFDYEPLYDGKQVLNQSVNHTPQTYQVDDLFDGNTNPAQANYSGQGVWNFPARKARYLEFVFDQDTSSRTIVGQNVYSIIDKSSGQISQIPEPEELKDSPAGEYMRVIDGKNVVYKKEVIATTGWRYAIGIRDVHIMQYQFAEKSSFVSKRYHSDEEITKVTLYANEVLPDSYLETVMKNNDWIQYEVSFDDTNWYRISPMHHEPLSDDFPPKIIELNGSQVDLVQTFQVHKELVETSEPVHGVRIRITLQRPLGEEFADSTPILEDYALQIEKKGAF